MGRGITRDFAFSAYGAAGVGLVTLAPESGDAEVRHG